MICAKLHFVANTVGNGLVRTLQWHVHFTSPETSWINQVERFFATFTEDLIRRSSYTSTRQLECDINAFINRHDENPKPFVRSQMTSSKPSSATVR